MTTKINKKTNTENVLSFVTDRLNHDVADMSIKRNRAIDVFNATAKNLELINKDLQATADRCRKLAEQAMAKAEEAERMMADNNTVCQKIYEIIGTPSAATAA